MGGSTPSGGTGCPWSTMFDHEATEPHVASPGARPEEDAVFTGIVEDLGEVEAVEHMGDSARIHVRSATVTADARPGDSIAVNGVCLTVTALIEGPAGFVADVMGETLDRSSLSGVRPGTKVNLERSVRLEDRLGGHLVQGHVDGTGTVISREPQELHARYDGSAIGHASGGTGGRPPGVGWEVVRIGFPEEDLAKYVVHKGSIAVDGVSLTVSGISPPPEDPPWFE